jgi:hypothetical protein
MEENVAVYSRILRCVFAPPRENKGFGHAATLQQDVRYGVIKKAYQ